MSISFAPWDTHEYIFSHVRLGKTALKEFRCYEAKIEESEKGRQPPGVEHLYSFISSLRQDALSKTALFGKASLNEGARGALQFE